MLVVVVGFFVVGRIGGSIPYGWTASLVSGGLYVALLTLYGLYVGPGRRSGAVPFLIGGALLVPALIGWFFLVLVDDISGLDRRGSAFLLGELQVGGSVRACPHAADICGIFWWLFTLVMIGAALWIRAMIRLARPD
jgi:hypothetical protein